MPIDRRDFLEAAASLAAASLMPSVAWASAPPCKSGAERMWATLEDAVSCETWRGYANVELGEAISYSRAPRAISLLMRLARTDSAAATWGLWHLDTSEAWSLRRQFMSSPDVTTREIAGYDSPPSWSSLGNELTRSQARDEARRSSASDGRQLGRYLDGLKDAQFCAALVERNADGHQVFVGLTSLAEARDYRATRAALHIHDDHPDRELRCLAAGYLLGSMVPLQHRDPETAVPF